MEMKEGRYMLGMWFLAWDMKDFMATIYTDENPERPCKWNIEYRWRYYDPDDPGNEPFSGKDRKSFYEGCTKEPKGEEEMRRDMELVMAVVTREMPPKQKSFCPFYSSDPEKCAELLSKQPWAHVKKVTKEEYEKEQLKGEAL